MKKTLICVLAGLATPALAQGTAPLIDNARVTVRDVVLATIAIFMECPLDGTPAETKK